MALVSFKTFCGSGPSKNTENCQTSLFCKSQYISGWEDIKRCYTISGNVPVEKIIMSGQLSSF